MNSTAMTVVEKEAKKGAEGAAKPSAEKAGTAAAAEEKTKEPRPKRKQRPKRTAPGTQKGSEEAKRKAALVLEVLAGARTPTQAAEALGVSPMRYYTIESQALQGLLGACEPRHGGPKISPEKQVAKLSREAEKLRSDVARYQALARATQRAVGVSPPKTLKRTKTKDGGKNGRRRRRRKPTVRALKAAAGFQKGTAPGGETGEAATPVTATPAAKSG